MTNLNTSAANKLTCLDISTYTSNSLCLSISHLTIPYFQIVDNLWIACVII